MKAIIDNKIYDTDKCELLFTYQRRILKTTKGTYLRYTSKDLGTGYRDINELVILTEEEVKKVLIELNEIDLYQKEFGKLEEG